MMISTMDTNPTKNEARAVYTEEAARLRAIWDATPNRMSQAEFGETYNIGGQSAVNNFLKGASPLSLKAALGFARGLGVSMRDFSPRLADQAKAVAETATDLPPASPSPTPGPAKAGPGADRKKYLVAMHDPATEVQVGMVLVLADSMEDAHDRGVRLVQQHAAALRMDVEQLQTVVFQVHSFRPASWD
ncbi:hypothetical protein ACHFCA_17385 [Delftia tsuruhatensis]